MTHEGETNREALPFVETVREAFREFARRHGLTEVAADARSVNYRSPAGWLSIMHDPLSYELYVAVWPLVSELPIDRPFGMADLIRAVDPDRANEYRSFAATTPEAMRSGVKRLVDGLRRYGEQVLTPDGAFVTWQK